MSEAVILAIRDAIEGAIPEADLEVFGGGGHYTVQVISPVFAGKKMLESHKLVYAAIAHLMQGENAPVHAIDQLRTATP